MSKKAAILLADGFEEIEAVTPYDLLNEAGVQAEMVSVSDSLEVKGTNGLKVIADVLMKDYNFDEADCLVIPGGAGYQVLKKIPEVLTLIKQFAANENKVLGAICAGSSILGEMGIYNGKNYTCVPGLNGDFGGHFEKVHAVIDGNLVTGISVGGAMEFGFDLVEKLCSPAEKEKLEKQTCTIL